MNLDYIHYAFLALITVAALVFAYVGKMDVQAAFGIAGVAAGIAIPTVPSQTPPADLPPHG